VGKSKTVIDGVEIEYGQHLKRFGINITNYQQYVLIQGTVEPSARQLVYPQRDPCAYNSSQD